MKQTRRSLSYSRAALAAFAILLCGVTTLLFNRTAVIALAAPPPQSSAVRRLAILFDTSAMTADDLSRATSTALGFVDTRLTDAQQAAVLVSNGRVQVRQDFTSDRALLRDAIRGIGALPVSGGSDAAGRLAALRRGIDMLSPIEGRKAVVYLTAGGQFTPGNDVDATIKAAERANVAIYFIDARGVR
jgi:VWFA-related protein